MKRATGVSLQWMAAGVVWVVVVAATAWLAYAIWVKGAHHRDFYPRWAGARQALFYHRDLYAPETTRRMQMTLYGHPLPPDSDQQGFAYPATLVVYLFPLWWLNDVEVATAIWIGLSLGLMLLALLALRAQTNMPWWAAAGLLGWYFPLLMLFEGQVTGLVLASLSLGFWAWQRRWDGLSGLFLAVGLVKPELTLLPIAVMLWWSAREKRWRLWAAFVVANGLALALSVWVAGWWLPHWVAALGRYRRYAQVFWMPGWLWRVWPPWVLLWGMTLAAGMYFARCRLRCLLAASVPVGMLLFPQTLLWGLTMMLFPLTLAWSDRSRWPIVGVWLLGWLSMEGNLLSWQWWKVQMAVIPLLVLLVVVFESVEICGWLKQSSMPGM